jgi:hypothetical protein
MAIWRGTGGPGDATTDAASEASAAANSATSAAASASAAASSANQAEVALDEFTDLYLGERGSDPTVDLDGNPLQTGALYFSTSAQGIKVYNGSIWLNAYDTSVLLPNNNLSDLDNAATSRTNLGVEIGTDVQAYDAQLTDIAGLTPTDSNFIVGDGTNFVLESDNTARTSLGLGTGDSPTFTNISVSGTVDGRDVAADGTKLDGIESGATADQTAGEIKTAYESNADTNAFTDAEQTKLSGIETGADVTDVDNVTAAGALMDSEVTNLAEVKAFSSADYATAAQGTLADSALQSSDIGSTVQGYDADTAKTDTAQTFTASQRGTVTSDNDLSFDLSATNNFSCTPTAGGTLTFTNHTAGQSGFILLDNSSGYAITAAATTKINATDLTTISTAGVYVLSYFDNGTNAYIMVSRSFA